MQAERNNLIYHSCESDVVEKLTPLDLWMTMSLISPKLYTLHIANYIFL